jgi:hypothetical protein
MVLNLRRARWMRFFEARRGEVKFPAAIVPLDKPILNRIGMASAKLCRNHENVTFFLRNRYKIFAIGSVVLEKAVIHRLQTGK